MDVLVSHPADTKGYTHLVVHPPVGTTQASEPVVCGKGDDAHTIHLHGQREFDVPNGVEVRFPDGTSWKP